MDSNRQNPLDEYEVHGIKTVGDYDYFLLIDASGQCYIQQAANDDSLYLFAKMPEPATPGFAAAAAAIDAFWVNPESHTYRYMFQC